MRPSPRVTAAAVLLAAAALVGIVPSAAAAPVAPATPAYDVIDLKITCGAANVRTHPNSTSRLVGTAYRGDPGRVTKGKVNKPIKQGGHYTHWYGTWKHQGRNVTGWVIFDCANPYEQ